MANDLGGFGTGMLPDIIAYIGLKGLESFNSDLDKINGKVGSTSLGMQLTMTDMVHRVANFISQTIVEAAKFESSMANVRTVIGKGNDAFLAQMEEDLLGLSKRLPFTANEFSDALYDIISYGVPASEAIKVLQTSAEAAVGGFTNVNSTFSLFASIVKGYGLDWKDVHEISDKMFLVASQGATTIEQLSRSMGSMIPFAKTLGMQLDEVYAAMATLPGVTGTTNEAATQLTSVMTALLDPPEKLAKAFRELGVASGQELIDKMGGLQGALFALKEYTEKHDVSIGTLLGRKEALLAFYNLTGSQAKEYADKLKLMDDALGESAKALETKLGTTEAQWTLFWNNIKTPAISTWKDYVLPAMTEFISMLNQAVPQLTDAAKGFFGMSDEVYRNIDVEKYRKMINDTTGYQNALDLQEAQARIDKELAAQLEAVAAAQEKATKALQDYRDEIQKNAKQALVDINAEFFKISETFGQFGPEDEHGFVIFDEHQISAVGEVRGIISDLPDKLEEAKRGTEKFNSTAEKGKKEWASYASYIGQLVDKLPIHNKAVKDGVDIIATLATGSFDPISLGIQGLGLVMDALGGSGDKVKLTMDQVKDSLGPLGDEIDRVAAAMDGLNSSFKSDRLDQLQSLQQILLDGITFIKNSLPKEAAEKAIKPLQEQLTATTDELNRLTSAFQLQQRFESTSESLEYLTEKATEFVDKYKSGDTSGIALLLDEQIQKSEELLQTLDPTSKAYDELKAQIDSASSLYGRLTGQVETATAAINRQANAIDDLNDLQINLAGYKIYGEGDVLHGGGFPKAHGGRLFPEETFAIIRKDEMVLRPEATREFGAQALINFNHDLNPDHLRKSSARPQPVIVKVNRAAPDTYIELSDRVIQPRINYRENKMRVEANPYD